MRRRHTARNLQVDRQGHLLRLGQEKFDSLRAEDIGDFMRVRENSRHAVQQQDFRQFAGRQHGALQMNMGVHQARRHVLAAHVDFPFAAVRADADDMGPANGHIRLLPGARKDVEDVPSLEDQIGLLQALRHGNIHSDAFFRSYIHDSHLSENRQRRFGNIIPHPGELLRKIRAGTAAFCYNKLYCEKYGKDGPSWIP